MASVRKRGGKWEFTVKCKAVREKPFTFTFDDEAEGRAYCEKLEALLRQGLVPPELIEDNKEFTLIGDVIVAYERARSITEDDKRLLGVMMVRIGSAKLAAVNYAWAEDWIREMKVSLNLSPSTIRHYVGALARAFDWGSNRRIPELVVNPLRLLPRGYATYNGHDIAAVGEEGAKEDIERDRRLEDGEEGRIRRIMDGEKMPGKERGFTLRQRPAIICMFNLGLETAMRMREIYTLHLDQVVFDKRTIFLDKTKNGTKRQVPMSTVAMATLSSYISLVKVGDESMCGFAFDGGRLFPWWGGNRDKRELRRVTAQLSQQYARIFKGAGCEDLSFHDLRHEATSRLFEKTTLSDGEIMKITGHKSAKMLLRYANLRGSSLAEKLW
jgi:integrase